jgi:Na+/H+ antiporter NhaC
MSSEREPESDSTLFRPAARPRSFATGALVLLAVAVLSLPAGAQEDGDFAFDGGASVLLSGTPVNVTVTGPADRLERLTLRLVQGDVVADSSATLTDDGALFEVTAPRSGLAELQLWEETAVSPPRTVRVWPRWISIVPPLLAIAVALMFKQVIIALFLGLWVGASALVVTVNSDTVTPLGPLAVLRGLLDSFQVFVLGAVTNQGQAQILLFSFMVGGTVGIVIKNGGMQGVVNYIVRWATDPRRGQLVAGSLGIAIFFDDYANTLVVGNTMRQVTDRLRVSREKLAYIVDSTAAPIACVALVTTWIGFEVGLIGSSVALLPDLQEAPYSIFLNSIAYSFYPLLTIFMVFLLAGTGRDYGPMLAAENRARTTGQVLGPDAKVDAAAAADSEELHPVPDRPIRAINAVLPIAVLIFGVMTTLYVTGSGDNIRDIIGSADSYQALMWGSVLSTVVAALLSLGQRILTGKEVVDAWYAGLKSMLFAMIILVLAWSLSAVSGELHTAEFLVSVLGDSLNPAFVPSIVFVLSAATAFATGSSWSTMGILMPLILPLVWAVLSGDSTQMHILYSAVACVLAGAVMGDHCSPISDTTILSSMASGCDHIDHVRTQLPYAMTVGTIAVLFGTLPAGFGLPWWAGLVAGAGVVTGVVFYVGRPVES